MPIVGVAGWNEQVEQGIKLCIIDFAPLPKANGPETREARLALGKECSEKAFEIIRDLQSKL